MDADELVRRAEQEVAAGSPSARKTLDRARQALLRQRDTEGLEHLVELAGRIDKPGNLPSMIQQNLGLLEQQARDGPPTSKGGLGVDTLIAGLLGTILGAVGGIAFSFWILSDVETDALVVLVSAIFFCFVGAPLGAGLALGLLWLVKLASD